MAVERRETKKVEQKEEKKATGLRITGNAIIWKNEEYGSCSITLGKKKKDDKGNDIVVKGKTQFDNAYLPCDFKKGEKPENGTEILIKDAFLTFFEKRDETKVISLFILDYKELDVKK